MSRIILRLAPIAAFGAAMLLGGCVIAPGYGGPGYYSPGPIVVGGWGWGHHRRY